VRRLVLERGHVPRLHAVDCKEVHPCSDKRDVAPSVDDVLVAARAGCCAPTVDEWRLAVLDADQRISDPRARAIAN